tara:strand:- start:640 stop:1098 length:459 start_codon:yes stop_codon:yes gene_type:complete
MTLYFPNENVPGIDTHFFLNGDFAGYNSYRFELVSKYTNNDIKEGNTTVDWSLPAVLVLSNARYSEFAFPYPTSDYVKDSFRSGYYNFTLWGTELILDEMDPFISSEWSSLLTGEVKVKTKTTDNMQRSSSTAETVKYVTEPNTAKSYIIYK